MNFHGKMNARVADAIGKGLQEAQKPLDAREYNKACGMYYSIIADFGFDTSFGPDSTPDSKLEQETAEASASSVS